ncbi:hypothetical protein JCM10450v2_000448 [Rhodotorula kratochvilovae]
MTAPTHRAVDHGLRAADRWTAALPALADALADDDYATVDALVHRGEADEDSKAQQVRKVVLARRALLDLQDRILSWEALYGEGAPPPTPRFPHESSSEDKVDGPADEDEEDGWGELDLPPEDEPAVADATKECPAVQPTAEADSPSRPALSTFLSTPLVSTALSLASASALPELTLLCTLHPSALYPARTALLDAIPLWADPASFIDLLPALDASSGAERDWEDLAPWRATPDWAEALPSLSPSPSPSPSAARRTAAALRAWYLSRVERTADAGLVDAALALVQHGAARGVPGLDEAGEELSLLARLVYDRPGAGASDEPAMTLAAWRKLTPEEVIQAYTATSAPDELPSTLRRLVAPYLSVLESRLERAGGHPADPDPAAASRALLHAFLVGLPLARADGLDALACVVAASKPTLPPPERIVSDDADLARVVLAALYGAGGAVASERGAAACGRMFECLPAFADSSSSSAASSSPGADLFALAAPPPGTPASAPPPAAPAPSALLAALGASSPAALSAHLDALDLHLSQLEVLLRYSSAPPSGLAWFLSSYESAPAQAQWATRLARTAAAGGASGGEGAFEGEDEWVGLMEFMREATGVAGEPGEEEEERRKRGLGRMFWRLGEEEVLRVFFGGLLGAGRFSLARALFEPSSVAPPLEPRIVEELVIAASREFYDNAEEGNLHSGEMKLAFECLSAAPQQSSAIRRERDFIEATSRLCSFRLDSRPGIPLTPIELRHASDRLSFVARLLGSNASAHKHPEMVLALVHGLGYPAGGKDEVRALAMLADACIAAGDFPLAAEQCARAVRAVEALRRGAARANEPEKERDAEQGADYAWRACFALGKSGWADATKRLEAMGQALTLCPPERIQDLLPAWTALERDVAQETLRRQREEAAGGSVSSKSAAAAHAGVLLSDPGEAARAAAQAAAAGAAKVSHFLAAAAAKTTSSAPSPQPPSPTSPAHAPPQGVQHLASETAAAASYTLRRAAAFLQGPSAAGGARPSSAQGSSPSRGARGDRPASPASPRSATLSPAAKVRAPPASAPPRSPSPPSRFASALSGLADAPPRPASSASAAAGGGAGDGGMFGFRAGLGEKFTAGVGWLIGADELLEREREEQELRRKRGGGAAPAPVPARREEVKVQKKAEEEEGDDWDTKLAPYAASYIPPVDVQRHGRGPVVLTLELGVEVEQVEVMMDVEEIPPTQEVLDAVSSLRSGDGLGRMQLELPWEGDVAGPSPGDGRMVIVVDTNVLISHLALLRDFTDLASSPTLPPSHRPLLLIPHIVVAELDGLKSSTRAADVSRGPSNPRGQSSIASLARAATNWLLQALSAPAEAGAVRRGETLFGAEGAPLGENNDSLVLDAALYHAQQGHARVVLLTGDRNLQLRATIEQVEALGVEDGMDASRLLERLTLPAATGGMLGRH